ncbi:tetratricopeptide repeat protein [Candidatus Parabeggiatoa sp. HSG14]|uniref:CHAT domain-containing protein n=1 Tax=Candidatus Parabeggiatoa sp. HSG14 TaxID=3055593 RepID=UPI0025A742DB|nr:tetratricopeptide repeat protein [Thiotrichales bacterium HSG14]
MTLKKWFVVLVIGLITLVAQATTLEDQSQLMAANTYDYMVMSYYQQGKFKQALSWAEKSFKIKTEVLGKKHANTLTSLNNLAMLYQNLGRLSEALPLLKKGYRLVKEVLGEKHPDTLLSLNNLAVTYQYLGHLNEALPLFEKSYRLSKEVLGKKHRQTLISLNNLALCYNHLGRLKEALPLFETGYRLRKELLGEKHPSTLMALNNLAFIYQNLGYLDKALPLFKKCYRFRKNILGERHIDTLTSLNNLAVIYQHFGHLSKALPLLEKSYRLLKEVLGETHPNTLLSLNNLAEIYRLLGYLNKALPLRETSYHLYKEKLGEKHPDTIQSLNNLAIIYQYLGRLDEALPLFENSYHLYKEVLGEKHQNTLISLHNLAEIHQILGHLDKALPLFERNYHLSKEVLGEQHPKTIQIRNNFAKIYLNLGRVADALHLAETGYRLSKKVLGKEHPNTLTSLNHLAVIYQELGDLDKALPLFEESYRLTKEVLGKKHINTINILNNLATIHQKLGNYDKALTLHRKGYRLSKNVLGKQHPETLKHLNNLASLYLHLGNYSEALPLFEKGYRLVKEVLGKKHPDTIRNLNNLAYVYAEQGNTNQAIKHFKKFMESVENLRSSNLSAENRQTLFKRWVHGYLKLSELYINQSRFQDAFRLAEMSKARTLLESLTTKLATQQSGLTATEQRHLQNEEASLAFLNDRIAKTLENNQLEEKITLETEKNQRVNKFKQFHRELMAKYPKYAKLSKVHIVSAKEGAKYLPTDAVFISYLINNNKVLAFTLQPDGTLTAHNLGKIPNLKKNIENYRRRLSLLKKDVKGRMVVLREKLKKNAEALSRELGKQLLAPLKKFIKDKPRWIISPNGILALIPFETLRFEGEQVIAKHHITYVQSLSVLKLLQERDKAYQNIKKRGTLLAMGAPLYEDETFPISHFSKETSISGNSNTETHGRRVSLLLRNGDYERVFSQLNLKWNNLPGALKELEQLEKLFFLKTHRLRIYKQADATEAKLQRLNKFGILAKYRYLVFSTHGYLSTEISALSSIVLGQINNPEGIDGYVTASEWAGYNLKSDLMVLSACETGVGEVVSGEGVMGLPYAFYVAGNKNTLLTLWSISDKVTTEFIARFFRKLKMGVGQIEALTTTKREFLKKGYGEAYWAAFVLYGV